MDTVNIYIPKTILNFKSGYLTGEIFHGDYKAEKEPTMVIIDEVICSNTNKDTIGKISQSSHLKTKEYRESSVWIILRIKPFLTYVYINGNCVKTEHMNLIFYNPSEIKHSLLLCRSETSSILSESMIHFVQRVKRQRTVQRNFYRIMNNAFINFILQFYVIVTYYISYIFVSVNNFLTKTVDSKSLLLLQFNNRIQQIEVLGQCLLKGEKLIMARIVGLLLFDVLLGFLSFTLIRYWTNASEILLVFQYSSKILAENVEELLKWLKGVPAGLKLNQPLAEFLSNFFSYNVYLWTFYLKMASPLLSFFANLFVYVGVLGVSFQIALILDFLKIAVLHIHCFYIFAARMHMFQMSLLASQWRGFRGKKWNPLKNRVDARPDYWQRPLIKIIIAVVFTFVVFLMPTTTVYYVFFVLLRICLMVFEGCAKLVLWTLNTNPLFIAFLHWVDSPSLKGIFHFELEDRSLQAKEMQKAVSLRLTVASSPLQDCIAATHVEGLFSSMPVLDAGYILNSLIYGKLLL